MSNEQLYKTWACWELVGNEQLSWSENVQILPDTDITQDDGNAMYESLPDINTTKKKEKWMKRLAPLAPSGPAFTPIVVPKYEHPHESKLTPTYKTSVNRNGSTTPTENPLPPDDFVDPSAMGKNNLWSPIPYVQTVDYVHSTSEPIGRQGVEPHHFYSIHPDGFPTNQQPHSPMSTSPVPHYNNAPIVDKTEYLPKPLEHLLKYHLEGSCYVMICEVPLSIPIQDLQHFLLQYGEINKMEESRRNVGVLIVSYFDTRNSQVAASRIAYDSNNMFGQSFSADVCVPIIHGRRYHEDTMVELRDTSGEMLSIPEVSAIAGVYGTLKAISSGTNNSHLVEFFDSRSTSAAVKSLENSYRNGKQLQAGYVDVSQIKLKQGNSLSKFIKQSKMKKTTQNNDVDWKAIMSGKDKRTSLMIKNIPNRYTQNMLLEEINKYFFGMFDFFYLPIDFKNNCNVGYAFLNFVNATTIIDFMKRYDEKKWPMFNSVKKCKCKYARLQGLGEFIARFQNSDVMERETEYLPMTFYTQGKLKGTPAPFPKANRPR